MHAVLEHYQLCAHPCFAVWVALHAALSYSDVTLSWSQKHPSYAHLCALNEMRRAL